MTNNEYYQSNARTMAERDFSQCLNSDPSRYGAMEFSAWAKCYNEHYEKLRYENINT